MLDGDKAPCSRRVLSGLRIRFQVLVVMRSVGHKRLCQEVPPLVLAPRGAAQVPHHLVEVPAAPMWLSNSGAAICNKAMLQLLSAPKLCFSLVRPYGAWPGMEPGPQRFQFVIARGSVSFKQLCACMQDSVSSFHT